ncbi:MAG: hypothetical protein JNL98_34780, partial [Bryobacterales bacterium]|nr:hypothetical protein [Bryobacterales bacterium]
MLSRWVILAAGAAVVSAHDPITTKITFSKEISRLFQKRCVSCHFEGGKAPMSLETFESARPWAKAIKEEVLERKVTEPIQCSTAAITAGFIP